MRTSNYFFLYLAANILLLFFLFVHAGLHESRAETLLLENSALVKKLGLTDLCLFTEASYTRHLSQTDRNTPFQDCPLCLEHFPSGSILMPPEILKRPHGKFN